MKPGSAASAFMAMRGGQPDKKAHGATRSGFLAQAAIAAMQS